MNIAFVTPEFIKDGKLVSGGLATYISTVGKALVSRGHKVTVFLSGDSDQDIIFQGIHVIQRRPKINKLATLIKIGLSIFFTESMNRIVSSWSIHKILRQQQKKEKFDIIHYTNWRAIGLFRANGNVLLRISSYQRLWDNNPKAISLDKKACRFIEERSIKRFKHIIGPGDYLASIIKKDLNLKSQITILPTPVEKIEASSNNHYKVAGKKLVVYAGTISRIKGSDLLFEIIQEYLRRFNDTVFLIAGKSGSSNGQHASARIDSILHDFPDNFIYYPNLDRECLMAAFSQSDAVLIPSVIDNFPNTALEAMSQGALVISSNTASLGALIKDGSNGFILESRNPNVWIDCIRRVLFELDESQICKLRKNIKSSLAPYELGNAVDRLENYYKQIIKK